jgi:hypothetical protein
MPGLAIDFTRAIDNVPLYTAPGVGIHLYQNAHADSAIRGKVFGGSDLRPKKNFEMAHVFGVSEK